MNKIKYILVFFLLLLIPSFISAKEEVNVYLFHSETCMHCQAEIKFLDSIKEEYNLNLHYYETYFNADNKELMNKVKDKMNIKSQYVPFTIIGNVYYIGFSDTIETAILESIKNYNNKDVVDKIINNKDISDIEIISGEIGEIDTVFGKFNPATVSLPIISIVLGLVDGFNPCAMWVLVFLIGMLLNLKNKKKRIILGTIFLVTSGLVYLLFMVAWLNVATTAMSLKFIRYIIALVAFIIGIVNLRSYLKARKKDDGCEVVSSNKRKKVFKFIKNILSENSFLLASGGIIILACAVNIIELACSAGIPLIFTQILAMNDLTTFSYILYMLLYILFFMVDDIVVFVIAMVTLNVTGISTKYTKFSHLIGGIIMILIALLLIFKPSWLMLSM